MLVLLHSPAQTAARNPNSTSHVRPPCTGRGGRRPVPAGQLRSHFDLSADEFSMYHIQICFQGHRPAGRPRSPNFDLTCWFLHLPAQTAARNMSLHLETNLMCSIFKFVFSWRRPAGRPRSFNFDLTVGPFAFTRADGSQESQHHITCSPTLYRQGGADLYRQVSRDPPILISMLVLLHSPAQTAARNPNSTSHERPPCTGKGGADLYRQAS